MKYMDLLMTIILQAVKIPLWCLKRVLSALYLATAYGWHYTRLAQRILFVKIYRDQKRCKAKARALKKEAAERSPIEPRIKVVALPVVGKTKTAFITELPKLRTVEAFMSEPLETESVCTALEEPDIDPDDIEVETATQNIRDLLAQEDPDMFSLEGDIPSQGLSSGLTLEVLTQTYETLTAKNPSAEQQEAAATTLDAIEGSEFHRFFLLHKACADKAKRLMDKKKSSPRIAERDNSFDIDKYA